MRKYFIGFIAGLFVATYGVDGVVTLTKNLTGIAKEQVDDVMDIEK
mgnify:CR=1 FL=1